MQVLESCAVLHNMALRWGDMASTFFEEDSDDDEDDDDDDDYNEQVVIDDNLTRWGPVKLPDLENFTSIGTPKKLHKIDL